MKVPEVGGPLVTIEIEDTPLPHVSVNTKFDSIERELAGRAKFALVSKPPYTGVEIGVSAILLNTMEASSTDQTATHGLEFFELVLVSTVPWKTSLLVVSIVVLKGACKRTIEADASTTIMSTLAWPLRKSSVAFALIERATLRVELTPLASTGSTCKIALAFPATVGDNHGIID